jgi:NADPH-dependent 2,4-dienoyl-CoA reductase/sulfur reductase-like enzyme
MSACTRRSFGCLAGAACLAGVPALATPRQPAPGRAAPRVVIIGGGPGGATVARTLAMAESPLDITLIEPKTRYATCFFSNLYLAGLRSFESLTHGYDALADHYGIRVIHDRADTIDPVARSVRLAGGGHLAYDRLVVAPGIAFKDGAIPGYDEAATSVMPHAWMAGPQTQLLRRQLEEMPDGGVFVMAVPADPFRCPPGPYERASLVAAYFKQHKPHAKIRIIDAKDTFFEQDLFQEAWHRHYPGMIEWLPGEFTGGIESVDAKTRSIRTSGEIFKADVANIIPPQIAGELAHRAGLADSSGWCPVDPTTFESTLHPGIHLVGDAIASGQMPKSAFAANSQAKACAFAIASALTGAERSRLFLFNSCYTFLAPDDAVSDGISFKAAAGKIAVADIEISPVDESAAVRAQSVRDAEAWYEAFTRDIFG